MNHRNQIFNHFQSKIARQVDYQRNQSPFLLSPSLEIFASSFIYYYLSLLRFLRVGRPKILDQAPFFSANFTIINGLNYREERDSED